MTRHGQINLNSRCAPHSSPGAHLLLLPAALLVVAVSVSARSVELTLSPESSYLWGRGTSLASDTSLVIVGSPNGMRLFREEDQGGFVLVGKYEAPGGLKDVVFRDPIAYYADSRGVLRLVDLSDLGAPVDLGVFGAEPHASALALCAGRLLAAGNGQVNAFTLADPYNPTVVGQWLFSGDVFGITCEDSLVLLSQGDDGLLAGVQHTDGSLTQAGHFAVTAEGVPFPIYEAATDGQFTWIPYGENGVLVVDFTDPFAPVAASRIATYGNVTHVSIAGDRLLVADAVYGLLSYLVVMPLLPFWQYELGAFSDIRNLWSESESRFYAGEGTRMFAVDVDPLGRLSTVGSFPQSGSGGYGPVVREENWGFITDDGGLWLMDGYTADTDTSFVRLAQGWPLYGAVVHEGRLITAEGSFGARISDIDSLGTLTVMGLIETDAQVTGVAVTRDTLVVIEDGVGFRIFDITDPSNPSFLGRKRRSRQYAAATLLSSRYFCLGEEGAGVTLYDLRFPIKPRDIGHLTGAVSVRQLLVDGEFLYAADESNGVLVYSLSDPSSPVLTHQLVPPASATAFYRSGRTLYIGDGEGQITALDIADPSAVSVISTAELPAGIVGITKFGERLWVTTDAAVHAIDVLPPLEPGDFLANGHADVLDLGGMIDYIFSTGAPPFRPNAADVNGDGYVDVTDIGRLIDALFYGGPPMVHGQIE